MSINRHPLTNIPYVPAALSQLLSEEKNITLETLLPKIGPIKVRGVSHKGSTSHFPFYPDEDIGNAIVLRSKSNITIKEMFNALGTKEFFKSCVARDTKADVFLLYPAEPSLFTLAESDIHFMHSHIPADKKNKCLVLVDTRYRHVDATCR